MIRSEKRNTLFMMLITVLILACLFTVSFTFAKYLYTTFNTDSAEVAKFDVDIIAPSELGHISSESPFAHSFSDKDQSITFDFVVTNNKEVTVICTPHFDNEVQYYILIDEIEYESFVVEIGETIYFKVVVLADGLGIEETFTNFVLEISQL